MCVLQEFACNGTVVEHPEYGEVIQLQGDQRQLISTFLINTGIVNKEQVKVSDKRPRQSPHQLEFVSGICVSLWCREGGGGQVKVSEKWPRQAVSAPVGICLVMGGGVGR